MRHVLVSIGIPSLVRRLPDHAVTAVREDRLFLLRRLPLIIVGAFLVAANAIAVGAPGTTSLNSVRGYALLAILCCVALTVPIYLIGRRTVIRDMRLDGGEIVFLNLWTFCIVASATLSAALGLAGLTG